LIGRLELAVGVDRGQMPGRSLPDQLLALAIETMLQLAAGRTSDATGVADRLLDYERGIDPTQVEAGIYAEALFVAALPYCLDGRYDEAEANLNRSIAAARGGSSQVPTVACLGMQALLRVLAEDPAGAAVLATESLELTAELQLPQTALHTSPAHLVRVLTGTENQAREALEHLSKICDQIYLPYAVVAANLAEARFQMRIDDLERAQRALVAGRDLFDELEQPSDLLTRYYRVVTEAVPGQQPVPRPPGPEALTDRELQVLRAFSSNLTQREIGRELFLSFNTIKTYARSAYRKLGVSSRTEAVRACREAGLF
ncbi:MAG: LuxR C-terminal-related transcriptional regulator, partial [Actinomycetota bacterium]